MIKGDRMRGINTKTRFRFESKDNEFVDIRLNLDRAQNTNVGN